MRKQRKVRSLTIAHLNYWFIRTWFCGKFHQHFTHAFFKIAFCHNVTKEKLCKALSYEKRAHKMLMLLTPGIFFFWVKTPPDFSFLLFLLHFFHPVFLGMIDSISSCDESYSSNSILLREEKKKDILSDFFCWD